MRKKEKEIVNEEEKTIEYVTPIEKESIDLIEVTEQTKKDMEEYYERLIDEDLSVEVKAISESFKRATLNMTKSFTETLAIKDELGSRMWDIKKEQKKNLPSNASIDLKEKKQKHFASGLNIYKLLWICFMGSFFGVVVELLWCLITNGYIESRSGLVYGPFNLLYGIGAVVLTVFLYKFRNRGATLSFIGGTIIGTVVEYVCSWGQEVMFGTRSWDYSNLPFNVNGRVCLLYSLFWGFLGVLWIKDLYPMMSKWILKIPDKAGKITTWILVGFFVFNIFMSGVSLFRWQQRDEGIAASNSFWEFFDKHFPDERMKKVYANMEFTDE